jgi:hypothetical protein
MAAECYWCKTLLAPGSVSSPIGKRGEAIGCCLKCQVLACGNHAVRDKLKQEFKCWDCLFIKSVASAVAQSNLTNDEKQTLKNWDKTFEIVIRHIEDVFENFQDFEDGHPQLKEWINASKNDSINNDLWPFEVENIFRKFTGDAEKFLIASSHIISGIEKSESISEFEATFKYHLLSIVNNTMMR